MKQKENILTPEQVESLRKHREIRRTDEWLESYKQRLREIEEHYERERRSRIPSWEKMHTPFDF